MKVKRVLHLRAPLVMKHIFSRRQVEKEVLPYHIASHGGCTVILEGDTDNNAFITMKLARCNATDCYNRKKGVKTANEHDAEVVPLRKLAGFLKAEEKHMLLSCVPLLRRDDVTLKECQSDFDHVVRHFLPLPKQEQDGG